MRAGTPIEVDEDDEDELDERPGAEMVDFDRGRVKPRTIVFDPGRMCRCCTRRPNAIGKSAPRS